MRNDINKNYRPSGFLQFPDGFLWGASTSAYQVEGGIINDWSEWEMSDKRLNFLRKKGLNYQDFIAGKTCGSYGCYVEDADLLKHLNCNAHRLGLEWSRIEPVEGEFSAEAIQHYRHVLAALKYNGIKTVVTIWHWTNPMWLVHEGGWSNKKVVAYYKRYARFVAEELGDLVDYWVTLNEPTVHVLNGYVNGKFPPNKKNIFKAFQVLFNLIKAHKVAYSAIHEVLPKAQVSITHLGNNFDPARKWFLPEVILAVIANFLANGILMGKIKKHLDYIGLDYYFHNRMVFYPPFIRNKNKETTDMGWEIYPKGIFNVLKYLNRFKKPIIIMENGLADAADSRREKFILDHLFWTHRAIEEGVDVRGYFHWSLVDNFEWAHGWIPKFGLCELDRKTLERRPRPSAWRYAEICRDNGFYID
jgi:beta-glucosidase